jgi:hypothetical protein
MIGLLLNGFSGLPIEASLLWLAITWGTIIIYETIYTLLLVERSPLKPMEDGKFVNDSHISRS